MSYHCSLLIGSYTDPNGTGQQDRLLQYHHFVPDLEALPVVADSGNYFEAQAKVAESIGMSLSVVKQMRVGEYSFDQIETLLQQRQHVIDVIRKAESSSALSSPLLPMTSTLRSQPPSESVIASVGTIAAPAVQENNKDLLPMTPAGTPTNTPADSVSTTPTKTNKSVRKLTCNFQVCHACRPFFQDRISLSFDTVLNSEVPALTDDEILKLPILDASMVRNLGVRLPPKPAPLDIQSHEGMNIAAHQGDGYADESSEDWTPTSTSNSEASSSLLQDTNDLYPCPGSGICPVWNESEGCAYENGFDDGKRAIHHGFAADQEFEHASNAHPYGYLRRTRDKITGTPGGTSSTGSSISLPELRTEPLTPTTPSDPALSFALEGKLGKAGKAATVCGVTFDDRRHKYGFGKSGIAGKDSNSSLGSEVEVEGGVALTEEAVESGMPDIVTRD